MNLNWNEIIHTTYLWDSSNFIYDNENLKDENNGNKQKKNGKKQHAAGIGDTNKLLKTRKIEIKKFPPNQLIVIKNKA